MWVRFVGHSLLVHGASGPEVAWSRGYFFGSAPLTDPTYAGPTGLLRMLRSGSLGTTGGRFAGVEFYADGKNPVPMYRTLVIPVAYPLLLSAVAPALWVAGRVRTARRRREGCCTNCGYDLRATPSRCPECGAAPKDAPVA